MVAALSKARNVLDCSNTEVMGSDPTRSMDICLLFPVYVVLSS
jgi:hypothetical protein